MTARCLARWTAVALIVAAMPGCGNSHLGRVTGTVRMDGEPLVDAMVTFKPQSGIRPAAGRTDEQGRFELIFSRSAKGAALGEHRVEISTYDEILTDDSTEIVPEVVPARYNTRSELTATVKPGQNVFHYDLQSDGAIIEPQE